MNSIIFMCGVWRVMIEDVLILDCGGVIGVLGPSVVIIVIVVIIAWHCIATLTVWTTILTYTKYLHEIQAATKYLCVKKIFCRYLDTCSPVPTLKVTDTVHVLPLSEIFLWTAPSCTALTVWVGVTRPERSVGNTDPLIITRQIGPV